MVENDFGIMLPVDNQIHCQMKFIRQRQSMVIPYIRKKKKNQYRFQRFQNVGREQEKQATDRSQERKYHKYGHVKRSKQLTSLHV